MRKIFLLLLCLPFLVNAITPTFCCGFECGVSGGHYTNTINVFSTTTVRSGARSLRANPSAATCSSLASSAQYSSVIAVIRVYVYFTTLPTTNSLWIALAAASGSSKGGVYYKVADGKLYARSQSGVDGATGISVTTGQWYRIDIKVNATTNPNLIDAKVDGVDLGQVSDPVAGSTLTDVSLLASLANLSCDVYVDDLLVSGTSGDYPIGAGYVNHFVPTSDGTHSGLTAADFQRTLTGTDIINSTTTAYQLLDDVPLESGSSVDWINMVAPVASTYVENVFGPAPGISTPTVAPRMASFIIGIHQAGTGTGTMIVQLNDNGTAGTIYSASIVAGTTTVIYKTANFADPPSAATVWTLSGNGNFNNARIRFGPTATVDANPDQYLDCAMIEAEFEEIALTVPGTPSDKRHTTLGVGGYALLSPHSKEIINQSTLRQAQGDNNLKFKK